MQRDAARLRRLFTAIGISLSLAGAVSGFLSVRELWWAARSVHWPEVAGTVIESRSGTAGRGRQHGAWKELTYRYEAGGRQYEGGQVTMGDVMDRDAILDLPRAYPPGSTVTVRHDPARPSRAVLEPGVSSAHWAGLFLPTILTLMGGAFLAGGRFGRCGDCGCEKLSC